MARTKTPTEQAPTTPEAPPDPPTQDVARPSPVLAWPAEWPVPDPPADKPKRTRGLPMAPVLAGAGNGTALAATAAYSAGGPAAAAAAGVVVAAGATAAVLRRRATVRRGVAARAGSGTSAGRMRSGARSGLLGSGGRGSGGGRRSATGGRSGAGSAGRSGSGRSGSGLSKLGGRSGGRGSRGSKGGLFRSGGRHAAGPGHAGTGKDTGRLKRSVKKAAEKAGKRAVEKALKQHAKNTTATPGKRHALKAAVGRAARAAWTATRPHAARASKATGRGIKKTSGALFDGARATAAAAWTWLRHRDAGAALDRLKNVWRRLRKKRQTPDPQPEPAVAATVRRPTHPNPTTPSTGGTMSGGGHHFVAPAMEAARAAAHYQPQGMLQVGADFAGLEEALRLHAEAMKVTVENADAQWPLHPNIVELMRQIHGLQLKAAELAAELRPAFRQLHDVDLARLENPRKGMAGERMWDVSTNL